MRATSTSHRRNSLRLSGYDYTLPGAYFVTLCVQDRRCLFGDVRDGVMCPNEVGCMIRKTWDEIPHAYPDVATDAFQLMPNHVHGIVLLGHRVHGNQLLSLAEVVRRFKTLSTRRYVDGVAHRCWLRFPGRLWQRNYYDHVIRGDRVLNAIRRYIVENPSKWAHDPENPDARRLNRR